MSVFGKGGPNAVEASRRVPGLPEPPFLPSEGAAHCGPARAYSAPLAGTFDVSSSNQFWMRLTAFRAPRLRFRQRASLVEYFASSAANRGCCQIGCQRRSSRRCGRSPAMAPPATARTRQAPRRRHRPAQECGRGLPRPLYLEKHRPDRPLTAAASRPRSAPDHVAPGRLARGLGRHACASRRGVREALVRR